MNPTSSHILIVPYPAQGHMIPLLDLTHHLATTTPNLTLTILTTPRNLPLLSSLLSSNPNQNITPLILPFPTTHGILDNVENAKGLPPSNVCQLIVTLSRLQDPLCQWFKSHPSPPVAVISDFFCGWTQSFASKVGIKRVVFSPSGALGLSVNYGLWRGMPKEGDGDVLFRDMPNCPKFPWWQVSPIYRSYVEGDGDSELLKEGFQDNMVSWGLVINTVGELERVYLDHLMSVIGHDRVWAVGPLLPAYGLNDRGGSSSVEPGLITSWLDKCRDNEAVYVSFGTQALLTMSQTVAVAEALEKSGVRFIWSMRGSLTSGIEGDDDTVLCGFEDRVTDRGMVIKGWAPQVSILRHRAVGTFLTHCGWNSTLEGLMGGVGMLAWPMGADQYANATLLVEELKVGVRVCEGHQAVPDPAILARIIAKAVNGDMLDRGKIADLHSNCLEAVKEDGSSTKELMRFVKKMTQ